MVLFISTWHCSLYSHQQHIAVVALLHQCSVICLYCDSELNAVALVDVIIKSYTLHQLAEDIYNHEKALAQCSNSLVEVFSSTEECYFYTSRKMKKTGCIVI